MLLFFYLMLFIMFFPLFEFELNTTFLELFLAINIYSLFYMLVILIISFFVLVFSYYYMGQNLLLFYFNNFLILFIVVMCFLIMSLEGWVLLIFWDLLGIVSFILVLFYMSPNSIIGSLSTLLSSRLGDFFFLMMTGFFLFFMPNLILSSFFLYFFFLLISMTKSAQFPFMAWLPKAMSAPTPVSALVHSSTLVTSGIILLLMNNWILKYYLFSMMLFIFSLLSFLFSGLLNLVEQDLKKMIALSTLSQLSLCMLSMGLCLYLISYSYMVIHALVKSLLFMVVGHMIYVSYGMQNLRNLSMFNNMLNLSLINISLFSLCGLMFLAMMILKESLLSYLMMSEIGLMLLLIYMGGFLMTFIYCMRIMFVGINSCSKNNYFFFSYSYLLSSMLFFFMIFFWYIDFTSFFFLPMELGSFFNMFFFCFFIYSSWLLKINNMSLVVKNMFLCNYFLLQLSRFLVWTPYFESFINKILLEFFMVLSYLSMKMVLLTSSNFSMVFMSMISMFLFLV